VSNNCLIFNYYKQIIVCFIAEYVSKGVVIVNMASSELICIVVDSDIPSGKCPKGLGVITNYVCDVMKCK